jgi:hypothetical protein
VNWQRLAKTSLLQVSRQTLPGSSRRLSACGIRAARRLMLSLVRSFRAALMRHLAVCVTLRLAQAKSLAQQQQTQLSKRAFKSRSAPKWQAKI